MSTEEAASDDIVWTIEAVKKRRERSLKKLPIYIEMHKKEIESLEEAYKQFSPDRGSFNKHRDQVKKTLDFKRDVLSRQQEMFKGLSQPDGLEYLIRDLGVEELLTEVDNEK